MASGTNALSGLAVSQELAEEIAPEAAGMQWQCLLHDKPVCSMLCMLSTTVGCCAAVHTILHVRHAVREDTHVTQQCL